MMLASFHTQVHLSSQVQVRVLAAKASQVGLAFALPQTGATKSMPSQKGQIGSLMVDVCEKVCVSILPEKP